MGKIKDFFEDAYYSDGRMPWWANMLLQIGVCLVAAVATGFILKATGVW